MNFVKTYKTKAKWALWHENGMPIIGYYRHDGPYRIQLTNPKAESFGPGVNVLLHGVLTVQGTARGMSAANLSLADQSGRHWTMSLSGTERLLGAIASGEVAISHVKGSTVLEGYWTFAKRGTEVSIIAAPSDVLC